MKIALRAGAWAGFTLAAALLALGPEARADGAAAAPHMQRASNSFDRFASGWMEKLRRGAAEHRQEVRQQGSAREATLREYDADFVTELKATGNAEAPYVGILRYVERLDHCGGGSCRAGQARWVTEIFRFQRGRWVY